MRIFVTFTSIFLLRATDEAEMKTASIAFKKYQVQRVVELRSIPRCPPFLFVFLVLPLDALGWALRKARVLDPDSKVLLSLGWSARPGFQWEMRTSAGTISTGKPGAEGDHFKPDGAALKHACAALQAAREVSISCVR